MEVQVLSTAPTHPMMDENADVAQLVERRLAKAKVAGSRPVVRSINVLGSLTRSGFTLEEHQGRVSRALPIWLCRQRFDAAAPERSETRRPLHYHVPLAQPDRAFDYESKGREFESLRARFSLYSREVAQLGRVLGLGPRGRRFESCLPDQFFQFDMPVWRNGRRARLKIVRETVGVQVPSPAPYFAGVVQW